MRTVILNLKRLDIAKPSKRQAPRASGIALRDKQAIRSSEKLVRLRDRTIPEGRLASLVETLDIYPEGHRERVFTAQVVRHSNMAQLIGIQSKVFFKWLTRGKVPFAAYCVHTGVTGYPPKAYLMEEAEALVTALNTHYLEHSTFRDTDVGLRRNVHATLNLIRGQKAKEYAHTSN